MKKIILAVAVVVMTGCATTKQCVDVGVVMFEDKAQVQQMCFEPLLNR